MMKKKNKFKNKNKSRGGLTPPYILIVDEKYLKEVKTNDTKRGA